MTSRSLRYTQGSLDKIGLNERHQFALDYAISVYARNTVFSFIPKNGCTTLRYSAALENQVIQGPNELGWIHANNKSFRPTHRELVTASYTFVILRCPFHRLVSCFLHKIVDRPALAHSLQTRVLENRLRLPGAIGKRISGYLQRKVTANLASQDDLTFADFVSLLETPGALRQNIHWRPQSDFLVYSNYDDVFRLEDTDSLVATVQAKAGFTVHDTRKFTAHGNHNRDRIPEGFFGRTGIHALRKLKAEMRVPAYELFFDADLYQRVSRLYHEDIELYAGNFGQFALMQLQ
jgi:Sulfotransferase family